MVNATINTLTKQFHLDEKMLRLSSSFTLLNVFEKKKGIMKNSSSGVDLGGGCRGCAPPPEMTCGFLIQLVFCQKKENNVVYWC